MKIGAHLTHVVVGAGADVAKLEAAVKAGVALVTEPWLEAAIAAGDFKSVDASDFAPPLGGAAAPAAAVARGAPAARAPPPAAETGGRAPPPVAELAEAAEAAPALRAPPPAAEGVKRALESPPDGSASVPKRAKGLLESILAASDAEITAGGSPEQLQRLSGRLPELKSHLAKLLALEARESKELPGLYILNIECNKKSIGTAASPTKVSIVVVTARLGEAEMCLTLRSCVVVNAEAEYCAWWLRDNRTLKLIYPAGPLELSADGETVGDGWKPPALATLEQWHIRCGSIRAPAGKGAPGEPPPCSFFRALLSALVSELCTAKGDLVIGDGLKEQLREFMDPECNPDIATL